MSIEAMPYIPPKFAEVIFGFGERLMLDDKFDVGHFAYRNRPHYHNGKKVYSHMSTIHHWYLGFPLLIIGQVLGALSEMMEAYRETEAEEEENTPVLYNDYVREMGAPKKKLTLHDLEKVMNVY